MHFHSNKVITTLEVFLLLTVVGGAKTPPRFGTENLLFLAVAFTFWWQKAKRGRMKSDSENSRSLFIEWKSGNFGQVTN